VAVGIEETIFIPKSGEQKKKNGPKKKKSISAIGLKTQAAQKAVVNPRTWETRGTPSWGSQADAKKEGEPFFSNH